MRPRGFFRNMFKKFFLKSIQRLLKNFKVLSFPKCFREHNAGAWLLYLIQNKTSLSWPARRLNAAPTCSTNPIARTFSFSENWNKARQTFLIKLFCRAQKHSIPLLLLLVRTPPEYRRGRRTVCVWVLYYLFPKTPGKRAFIWLSFREKTHTTGLCIPLGREQGCFTDSAQKDAVFRFVDGIFWEKVVALDFLLQETGRSVRN